MATRPVLGRIKDIRRRFESGDYIERVPHPGDRSDIEFLLSIVEDFYRMEKERA